MKKLAISIFVFSFFLVRAQNPFNKVREHINEDKSEGLLKILDSCLAKGFQRDSALFYSGLVNLKNKHVAEAQKNYNSLKDEFPKFTEAHYLHGMIHYMNQSYGKSIDEFSYAIRQNPKHIKALYNRSVALGQLEDFDFAIKDLNECIALNPNYALAYYSRAYWYESANNYPEAIKDYEVVLRLEPKNYDAYLGLAYAYQKVKEDLKACQTINKAISAGSQIAEEAKHNFCK